MKNRKAVVSMLCLLLAAAVLAGCANKAAIMLATYNSQTHETAVMSWREDLTAAQKEIVRKKKAVILRVDPLVKAYALTVKDGGTPSADDEQRMFNLIDELVSYVVTP